jgi:UDPglucose--hexose-1-phosphate uridylyltransferase
VIERNPLTGEPVIVAPARRERPNVYRGDDCPFCPGREQETPPAVVTDGDAWRIRVFPNKYPATERHEVIVESPRHDDGFDDLAPEHAARAVAVSLDRYRALRADAAHVLLFKNHGELAGASIPHLHSQIIGTPFVPPRVARESEAFAGAERCPLCNLQESLIEETPNYRWVAPRGAAFAYQQWIVPRGHAPEPDETCDSGELAELLQASARAMRPLADAFNWVFMSFPRQPRAHWYVDVFPRTAMTAGFEIGSGLAINTTEAAAAAAFLRGGR